ncbi:hypothetical protein PR002_g17526 [Phytophthora rubi]|uniref:ABC transporter domain-containing protein n=1 Tax=Phytophthora rubi TaxID=129364 RepID=A0A6A3KG85_9STRA|nr:hypothetical protein PR002_g17526 [Phytophthora rubi]
MCLGYLTLAFSSDERNPSNCKHQFAKAFFLGSTTRTVGKLTAADMPDLHIPVSPSVDVVYSALDSEPNIPTLTAEKKTINPCTLSWCNLIYTVDVKKSTKHPDGKKTILTNVTGRCAPGELTAVMGPSGSGKTTLLDILADRISSGTIEGSISLNGEKRNAKTFRAVSSYVAQEDSLMGSFTVSETLEMAARLSLPSIITRAVAVTPFITRTCINTY